MINIACQFTTDYKDWKLRDGDVFEEECKIEYFTIYILIEL